MKFTTNQLLVILAILIAGIIAAHVWAPGAVAMIWSITTAIVTTFFVNKKDGGDPPDDTGTPNLKIIAGGLGVVAFVVLLLLTAPIMALFALGCGPSYVDLEKAAAGGEVSKPLQKCRAEARTVFYADGGTEDAGLAVYEACKRRAGLQ